MRMYASVLGIPDVTRRLQELEQKVQNKSVREAVTEGATEALHLARSKAPHETGQLVGGLELTKMKNKKNKIWRLVTTGTRAEMGIPENSIHYWPAGVEFGHYTRSSNRASARFADLWKKGERVKANRIREGEMLHGTRRFIEGAHFMRDSIMKMRAKFPHIMKEHLEDLLRRGRVMSAREKAHERHIIQKTTAAFHKAEVAAGRMTVSGGVYRTVK